MARYARFGGTAVTDLTRDAATGQLREHYAAGRLSLDQFQARLDEAYRAQTTRELDAVTDGLPHVGRVIPSGAPWGSYPGGYTVNVAKMRAAAARTGRRILLAFGLLTAGSLVVLALVITAFLVHGGLLAAVVGALLAILAAGVAAMGCHGVAGLATVAAPRLDRGGSADGRPAVADPSRADRPRAAHQSRPLEAANPPGVPRLSEVTCKQGGWGPNARLSAPRRWSSWLSSPTRNCLSWTSRPPGWTSKGGAVSGRRKIADGTASQIKAMAAGRTVRATLAGASEAELRAIPGADSVEVCGDTVLIHSGDSDARRELPARTRPETPNATRNCNQPA